MQADYAQSYRTLWERHWWWRSREALLLDRIGRLDRLAPIRRILDVGCGDGLFFERLGRFGRVEGLEPDASLLGDPPCPPTLQPGLARRGGRWPGSQGRRAEPIAMGPGLSTGPRPRPGSM